MSETNTTYDEIEKLKQKQVLKIVASSFYKELVKYGIKDSDIVSVSMNLLDYVTASEKHDLAEKRAAFPFSSSDVQNNWHHDKSILLAETSICPLETKHVKKVAKWLTSPEIENTFIGYFPKNEQDLSDYLLNRKEHRYFAIYIDRIKFVGVIGAERINERFKKLEMKKFVGDKDFRSK